MKTYVGERCADLFTGVTVVGDGADRPLELTTANKPHAYRPFDWGGGACPGSRALAYALIRDALAMRDVPEWLAIGVEHRLVLRLKRPEFRLDPGPVAKAVADVILDQGKEIDLSKEPWKDE